MTFSSLFFLSKISLLRLLLLFQAILQSSLVVPDHTAMDPGGEPTPIFTLKVDITCCSKCRHKAKERLQKINGVKSFSYNVKEQLATVCGNVDPWLIVKKFEKWGKKAEIWLFERVPLDSNRQFKTDSVSVSTSDSDDERHDENCNLIKNQNPDDLMPKQTTSTKKQSAKKMLWSCLFGKKEKKPKTSTSAPDKWHFPKLPNPSSGGGVNRPFVSPFNAVPKYWNQPHSSTLLQSAPFFSFYRPLAPPPPRLMWQQPPPYGFFRSRSPPRMNAMIHYTNYEDNYYP